jgi:hypothetical protein
MAMGSSLVDGSLAARRDIGLPNQKNLGAVVGV